jgi:translation initiation factor eIF-2B subunit epsilon
MSIDGTKVSPDVKLLGSGADGALFTDPEEEELDESDPSSLQRRLIYSIDHLSLSDSSISTLDSDLDDSDDDDSHANLESPSTSQGRPSRERLSSFASDDSATSKAGFHSDAVQGLLEALRDEGADFDSAKLEFMGLRLANDASDKSVRKAVAVAFTLRAAELLDTGVEPSKAANGALKSRKGAIKFISEVATSGGESEQVAFSLALQRAVVGVKGLETGRAGNLLAAMFQQLYNEDVLEEEGILGWWASESASQGESMSAVRVKCQVLVEWLENADEEDDDDDEDDDDE